MDVPRNLSIQVPEDGKFSFTIGEHDFADLVIMQSGPIVECLTPGAPNPAYCAWIPVMFEGEIDDPHHVLRIVHDGEAGSLGVPKTGRDNGDK